MPRLLTSLRPLCVALLALGSAAPALAHDRAPAAQTPRPERVDLAPDAHAYALVVGSNPGGPGQEPLAFAERDAQRMAEVLTELGHYPAARVDLLQAPSRAQLAGALRRLRQRLSVHDARGEQSVVFFYYSGHAQSQALRHEATLGALRAEIDRLAALRPPRARAAAKKAKPDPAPPPAPLPAVRKRRAQSPGG